MGSPDDDLIPLTNLLWSFQERPVDPRLAEAVFCTDPDRATVVIKFAVNCCDIPRGAPDINLSKITAERDHLTTEARL